MLNSGPLAFLGIAILIACALNIVVPYLRGKSDILTAWNIVWFGGAMFTGVGSLAVAYGTFHWPELQWFQPTKTDVRNYIIGSLVFYGTLMITYYVFSWPRRLTARIFNRWPPTTFSLLVFSLSMFAAIAIVNETTKGLPFLGTLLFNITHKALVFAVVFAFCYWYRDRRQLVLLALFVGVFAFAATDAMVLFRGRRLLLSVAVSPLICLYWLRWRYLSPRTNLIRVGLATTLAFAVVATYSVFRRFDTRGGMAEERTFSSIFHAMKDVKADDALHAVTGNAFFYFSNYCVHYSLLTMQLVDKGQIPVEPLHSLEFIATYPIPRAVYPTKPQLLSGRIVNDVLHMPYKTNWGLGIVGTGYYEGGMLVIVLYAVIIVLVCRVVDDPLRRQPTNPFLLSVFATSAPHFAAIIRGDFAIMLVRLRKQLPSLGQLDCSRDSCTGAPCCPECRGLYRQYSNG